MKNKGDERGFSLVELLIVILILNILGAVVITAYVGIKDKARRGAMTSIASSARKDLQHWLSSSISNKANIREIDTDFNGVIDINDSTNGALLNNVAVFYTAGRNTMLGEGSPWFSIPLWNIGPPVSGTISLTQTASNQITLVATEKNGQIIANYIITVD